MTSREALSTLAAAVAACVLTSTSVTLHAQARGTPIPPSVSKARLTEARAAAKAWKGDAVLIQIASRLVDANGMTTSWEYGFWSASAKTCAVINVYPGRPAMTRESGGAICEEPELKDFALESDQALKIARSNGITATRVSMVVSMSTPLKGTARAMWMVMDESGVKPGNVMLDIDANTGAVVGKTKQ